MNCETQALKDELLRLQVEEKRLLLRRSRRAWTSPVAVVALFGLAVSAVGLVFQGWSASYDKREAKLEVLNLQYEISQLREAKASVAAALEAISKRMSAARELVGQAEALLGQAKSSAPPTLQLEIDDWRERFTSWEAMRKQYDPTGHFPLHVPPEK